MTCHVSPRFAVQKDPSRMAGTPQHLPFTTNTPTSRSPSVVVSSSVRSFTQIRAATNEVHQHSPSHCHQCVRLDPAQTCRGPAPTRRHGGGHLHPPLQRLGRGSLIDSTISGHGDHATGGGPQWRSRRRTRSFRLPSGVTHHHQSRTTIIAPSYSPGFVSPGYYAPPPSGLGLAIGINAVSGIADGFREARQENELRSTRDQLTEARIKEAEMESRLRQLEQQQQLMMAPR